MLTYKKMNLFDAPKGSALVHACNARGVWGSGIAAQFKERFPYAFDIYNNKCNEEYDLVGSIIHIYEDNVVCLITSEGESKDKDSVSDILIQTTLALNQIWPSVAGETIYSPKFNSGFFGVPWEETEKILLYFVNRYNLDWIVCDPNLEE